MKLYDVPRDNYVKIVDKSVKIPPASIGVKSDTILHFDHVDGMYSFCRDIHGNIVHIAAWTDVDIVDEEEFLSQTPSQN